jgi:hypothetical protein
VIYLFATASLLSAFLAGILFESYSVFGRRKVLWEVLLRIAFAIGFMKWALEG